jgi:pimeloyl-ACP methyl ester carboxylesterase
VVPLSYAHPHGAKISLAVSRVKHTAPAGYRGVMVTNPGGPGGSGLSLATLGSAVPGNVGDFYDWVGVDPRGVGESRPLLTCDGHYFHGDRPPYVPRTRHLMRTWLGRARGYAHDCAAAKAHRLLGHMRTMDAVRDLESLRKALHRPRINYYGYSYGTYVAQVYATLHPDRVRRFVLDSNLDPRFVSYGDQIRQEPAFDRNVGIYFQWLADHNRAYHLGTDPQAIKRGYYAQLRKLTRHPAGGVLGPDELTDVFTDAAYYVYDWAVIGRAYARWVNHGGAGLLKTLYHALDPIGPGADNGYAAYLSTVCTDNPWPHRPKQRRDAWRIHRQHPFLAWANTWLNAPCTYWPARAGHRPTVDGSRVTVPVLLIDETNDAATPYSGSLEVRSLFPTASLIEGVGGTTHAGSLSGVDCVDQAVASYLAAGVVPQRQPGRGSDLKCDPVPPPSPQGSSAAGSATARVLPGR